MKIYNELNSNQNLVLALGFFDGIHIGHQTVIKNAVSYTKEHHLESAIITFKEHPYCYINSISPKYITQNREKYIEELGIDYLYELNFNGTIASLEADDYLKNIIIDTFSPKAIFTGFNHTFGKNKSGDSEFLKLNQSKYNYEYFEIEPQKIDNKIISSTAIRNYLQQGNIINANKMLGRNFTITGKIVEGQKLGRELGYRTANLIYPQNITGIPYGVYKVKTNYGNGITNFGIRPTVNNTNTAVLETHIFDFNKDIYGETLNIEFIGMIRKEQKFSSVKDLKNQIIKDIETINSQNLT